MENTKLSFSKRIAALFLVFAMLAMTLPVSVFAASSAKADIVFIIDATGSMGDEISNVKNNLNKFTSTLNSASIDHRISVIEYRDITISEKTSILKSADGEVWNRNPDDVASILDSIEAVGGGDIPETLLDALGMAIFDSSLDFRNDASKFAIVLTDADYKNDNNYGLVSMDDTIIQLQEKGICTSVITSSSYKSTYSSLYESTDGIYCDINSNFSDSLIELASYVKKVVQPVTIKLSAVEQSSNALNYTYEISATIESNDEELTAENLTVNLTPDSGMTVVGNSKQTIASILPKESKECKWTVNVPKSSENRNYTYSVNVKCDDFATGVVCVAQDTFSTIGTSSYDYSFVYDVDNYKTINGYNWFGKKGNSIYVSEEDLNAFVNGLTNTDLSCIASSWSSDGSVEEFLNNNLETWGGSCYGMSLTAGLFKVEILDSSKYGATTVYQLPELNADSNTKLESMINIYQMSQSTKFASNTGVAINPSNPEFTSTMQTMWNKANNIGKSGSEQQPFLVRLSGTLGGHAVLCFGAESCSVTHNSTVYNKRLKIYDPNSTSEAYLYMSDDYKTVEFWSNGSYQNSYTNFGYRNATLSKLNAYDYEDVISNYKSILAAKNMTSYSISSELGTAVFIAGKLVSNDLAVEINDVESLEGGSTSCTVILPNKDSSYTVASDEKIDADIYYEDFSIGVDAYADNAVFNSDKSVTVENATGEFTISNAFDNDSDFDFIDISGKANGNISSKKTDDGIILSGDFSDIKIKDYDIKDSLEIKIPNVNSDILIVADGTKEVGVNVYYDGDGDGELDEPISAIKEITTLTLDKNELVLQKGQKTSLTASVSPSDITDAKITWTSSNESVATVSETGEVKGIKPGKATITATAENGVSATCEVTVRVVSKYYMVNASSNYGGIVSPKRTHIVKAGNSDTIKISPYYGYKIDSVTVNDKAVPVINNTVTLKNIDENCSVYVKFVRADKFNVTVTANKGGYVSHIGTSEITANGFMKIAVIPKIGYRIKSIKKDGISIRPSCCVFLTKINEDHTVDVEFEKISRLTKKDIDEAFRGMK